MDLLSGMWGISLALVIYQVLQSPLLREKNKL